MESLSEAVYYASGCSSVADFISSPLICQGVRFAYLGDEVSWGSYNSLPAGKNPYLQFSLKKLRAREPRGSLPRFLQALPTCIPSCTHLGLWCELASLDELSALCLGIASPLCTLHSLELKFTLTTASADAKKRLIADALVRNTSLHCLTIISELCVEEDHWIPCSVKFLHVELTGDDTLDVLLGVFTGLAQNSISLTTIFITGPYGPSCGIDHAGFIRPMMLESERQLGITLSTNTSLTCLQLYNLIMPYEAFRLLFTSLNKNPNLTSFTLCAYPYLPGEVVCMLFTALEENHYLTSLAVTHSHGEDWPSASSILDSLRVNDTLTSLELDETPYEWDEERAAIFAQLERNRKNVEQ